MIMRPPGFWLTMCVSLFLFACTGGPRPANMLSETPVAHEEQTTGTGEEYKLGPGDILGVTFLSDKPTGGDYLLQNGDTLLIEFHRLEYLNRNVVVRPDGKITAPYLGEIKAAGISPSDFSSRLVALYTEKKIFTRPEITVTVVSSNSRLKELQTAFNTSSSGQTKEAAVGMDGYIRLPYVQPIMAMDKTVRELASEVKTAFGPVLESAEVAVELKQVRSNLIYVVGEVNQPGMHNLTAGTTVAQSIAMAGGYKAGSGLGSVVLIRPDENGHPMGRLVDVSDILSKGNLGLDVMLKRYDVVYVPPSTIQKLNDFVLFYIRNMMPFPTSAGANVGFNYMWGPGSLSSTAAQSTSFSPF